MTATHGRLWFNDRAYRLSWVVLPQAAALVAATLLFTQAPGGQKDKWTAGNTHWDAADKPLQTLRDKAVEQGDRDALRQLEADSETGNALAHFYLGTVYDPKLSFKTRKIETNAKKALDYYALPVRLQMWSGIQLASDLKLDGGQSVFDPVAACTMLAEAEARGVKPLHEDGVALTELADCQAGVYAQNGFAGDAAKALPLYEKAAALNHSGALNKMGDIHRYGQLGQAKDLFKARAFYEKADKAGNNKATFNLSHFYAEGLGGLPKDPQQARRLIEKAADAGNAGANSDIGYNYEMGINGYPKDAAMAVQYYRKAADLGNLSALNNMGSAYENGLGGLPKDHDLAADFYLKAVEKQNRHTISLLLNKPGAFDNGVWRALQAALVKRGFAISPMDGAPNAATLEAIRKLGGTSVAETAATAAAMPPEEARAMAQQGGLDALRDKAGLQGNPKALSALETLAGSDDVKAQFFLATLLDPFFDKVYEGKTTNSDAMRAAQLYRPAANAGDAKALVNLGRLLADKSLPAYNAKEACTTLSRWWANKTEKPQDQAQLAAFLGDCFNGSQAANGIAADHAKVLAAYQAAADDNHAGAQSMLGRAHLYGWYGLKADPARARPYLEAAAGRNDAKALMVLGDMNALGQGGFAKDYAAARKLFEKCADMNEPWCVSRLAIYHEEGLGGYGKDLGAAMRLHQRAADLGEAYSAHLLARHTYGGNSAIGADHARAAQLYALALKGQSAAAAKDLTEQPGKYDSLFWQTLQKELNTLGYGLNVSGSPDAATLQAIQQAAKGGR